ncbi:uncharacterized protein LOC120262016 [Dioscorea cayenensis subsp. rotundata]|uniref:Uncharacterized protein LOC120262016 n=1 Tax=Dioscorea cayennensis subsp. rotundata TaxID=55577 RepID=A0AB40BH88_DIOCR|nr:uncharacterized protein LOC120262016 [Dioscorea cayenensis subsp. rotundata]
MESEEGFSEDIANPMKRRYSRSELESLRFAGVDYQRRLWDEVYQRLGSVVAGEFDCLRHPKQQPQRKPKKKEPPITFSEVLTENFGLGLDELDETDDLANNYLAGNSSGIDVEETLEDDDDSSDSESDSIQRPAFYVEGEPDFESGSPQDGMEYLRRVRWEANQIPKVKVAKLKPNKISNEQTNYMPNIPEIAKCPPNLLPSKQWEEAFLSEFLEIRKAFSGLENPCNQLFNSEISQNSCKKFEGKQWPEGTPTVSAILCMDVVSRAATLQKIISMLETARSLSKNDCQWLFALCVSVDNPLHAETSASLRCLLRKCMSLLAEKSEFDDEVVMLNMLATIAGKYFGQSGK